MEHVGYVSTITPKNNAPITTTAAMSLLVAFVGWTITANVSLAQRRKLIDGPTVICRLRFDSILNSARQNVRHFLRCRVLNVCLNYGVVYSPVSRHNTERHMYTV